MSIVAMPVRAATGPNGPAAPAIERWFKSDPGFGCMDPNARTVACGSSNMPDFGVYYGNADGGGGRPDAVVVVVYIPDPTGNARGVAAAAFRQGADGRYGFVKRLDGIVGDGVVPGTGVRFGGGKVAMTVAVLKPTDGQCCPTGRRRLSLDLR